MAAQFLPLEAALAAVLEHCPSLTSEEVPLAEAGGRVLAEEVIAGGDLPPFAQAAMDGYAVRAAEVAAATPAAPVCLRVAGEAVAGEGPGATLAAGTALRVMTGAPLPAGADAVVPLEWAEENEAGLVWIRRGVSPGHHIRRAGQDLRRGERLLEPGHRLRAQEVALLAALGRPTVRVSRHPRVAILSTGDELVEVGRPLAPGQTYSSNAYLLEALVRRCGGEPLRLPPAGDRMDDLHAGIQVGLAWGPDLFLTTGGTALGKRDLIRPVLEKQGGLFFWQVRIQPGRSVLWGHVAGVPLLGLPGSPTPCWVAFEVLGRPALLHMQGQRALRRPAVSATLHEGPRPLPDRTRLLPVVVEWGRAGYAARPATPGGRLWATMLHANGLAVLPPQGETTGKQVQVWLLDAPEIE